MDASVKRLFASYESFFNRFLQGEPDMTEAGELYAPEFIAASPTGVMTGRNDEEFRDNLIRGYDHYRAIGTRQMQVRDVRISPIEDLHCVAHVGWTATYLRRDGTDVDIDFEVHYLVQVLGGAAKVFGWVAGDENALLKQHGII